MIVMSNLRFAFRQLFKSLGFNFTYRFIVGRGFRLAVLGVLVGIGAALTTGKFLASQLVGIGASDSFTIFATGSFVLLIALLACWIPAQRASGISSMEALRVE
jgi:putative ABC transport system permease protein